MASKITSTSPFFTASPIFLLIDNTIPAIGAGTTSPSPVGAGEEAAFFSSTGALGAGVGAAANFCAASSFEISFSETINVSPFTSTSYFFI